MLLMDYRTATGFEALVGWLFLEERFERLTQLVSTGLERIGALEMKTGSERTKRRVINEIRRTDYRRPQCRIKRAFRSDKTIDKLFVLDGCQDGL